MSLFFLTALLSAEASTVAAPTPLPRTVPLFTSTSTAPSALPAVFDGRVLLRAEVNGHALWLHLDTGASSLYLGAQDAKSIGLSADPVTLYSEPVSIKLGTVGAQARLRILQHYGFESGGRRVSGLVGGPLFHANIVTIDYPRRWVMFYPPHTFVPPAGVVATPIELSDNVPVVTLSVGGVPGRFVLDTGSSITELSAGFARKIRLGFYRGEITTASPGGERSEAVYDGPNVILGHVTVQHPELAVAKPSRVTQDGVLGRDILSRFSVTLDYAHFLAYFVPG